jgi:uncharacterized protein (DUF433 family)
MAETKSYISIDEHGVRRVGGTRISLDSVVIAFQQGESAEEIQRNFPALSLEQVYGTITYFLSNRADVEAYLRAQNALWEQLENEQRSHPSAAVQRLRRLRAGQAGHVQ